MFNNTGTMWMESNYKGYGEFGGKDYYELLAQMNGYDKKDLKQLSYNTLRDVGVAIAFDNLKPKGENVLYPALVSDVKYNWRKHDFTKEAESDPNQGWH